MRLIDEIDFEPDIIDWIQSEFYIPELGGPIELYPHQIAALREARRRDENGELIYSVVVWSDIKKSAKSCIAAAVALYVAHFKKWGTIRIVANDLKQADSRVAYYLRRAITLNPGMNDIRQVNHKTTLPNQTTIEAVPIDPGGEAGGGDDLIIFSELWAAKHKAIKQMWSEMTLSPLKFGQSQRWVETYAGYSGESPVLENLYNRAVAGEKLDLSYTDEGGTFHNLADLKAYRSGDMFCVWNDRPRLPWQTERYYESERGVLVVDEFKRLHRNQWISSTSKFVPDMWWDLCKGKIPKFSPLRPVVLGVDAGVSDDNFSIVGGTRHAEKTFVRYAQRWQPPPKGKIDFLGTREEPGPERAIVRLCYFNNVVEVRYDPYQLHDMATRLRRGVYVNGNGDICEKWEAVKTISINMVEFTQGGKRLTADKQLYDAIRNRTLTHGGDADLTAHVKNANQKREGKRGDADDDGLRLRLVKRSQELKIDLAVALSMMNYDETPKNDEKPKEISRVVYNPVRIG